MHSATMDEPLLTDGEAGGRRGAGCPALRQGSIWGTAFNMCSATLGAGALSLPYAIQHTGVVLGLLLLLGTAVATHW